MSYSYSRIRPSNGLLSTTTPHNNSYDSNGNVRVELSPTPRPRTLLSREPLKITSSSTINRSHTFSKAEKPSHIIRSDTFILKNGHHSDEYSDEQTMPDYGTYSRSRSKSKSRNYSSDEKSRHYNDDKPNYATYSRSERKANGHDKSLYVNVDSNRKLSRSRQGSDDHQRQRRSHSQDSSDRYQTNTSTFTRRSSKPKRVESFMKKFDINFWKRRDSKDKSPTPQATNGGGDTLKRSKNIFNIITSSNKKSTRDVGIECKLDEEEREKLDYFDSSYNNNNNLGMGMRKSSIQSLNEEVPKYRRASSKPKVYEHGSTQLLTSIIKTPERRYNYKSTTTTIPSANHRVGFDVKSINNRNRHHSPTPNDYDERRKPVGVASPQPQIRNRSVLKSGLSNGNSLKKTTTTTNTFKSTRLLTSSNNNNNNNENINHNDNSADDDLIRQGSDRMSFREYRERLLKLKNENRRMADNSDDDLRKSHQQSFFVPI